MVDGHLTKVLQSGLLALVFVGMIGINPTLRVLETVGEEPDIYMDFYFTKPVINPCSGIENQVQQIDLQGLPTTNTYNMPRVPVKPVRLLLPCGTTVQSLEVLAADKQSLGTGFQLEVGGNVIPLPHDRSLIDTQYATVNPELTHGTGIVVPGVLSETTGVYIFRGYSILHVNLFPVHYNKTTGELIYYEHLQLRVTTTESAVVGVVRGGYQDQILVKAMVANPSAITTYESDLMQRSSSSETYDYVIITNEVLQHADGEYTFQDLMDYKQSKGRNPVLVTVEDIMSNPDYAVNGRWGDNTPSNPFYQRDVSENLSLFDDTQARIRNFIRYAYTEWGTEYVLLGGDADVINEADNIIPARGLFANESGLPLTSATAEEEDDIPSDIYYACLDGCFNYDMDHHFGESADRNNITMLDEADLYAEVWVGRACVDSADEVSNFVMKSLAYEQTTTESYLSQILFLGEDLGSLFYTRWGGEYKDEIEYCIPMQYHVNKLYDRDHEYNDWTPGELMKLLEDSPSQIINHDGHGNQNYLMKMFSSQIRQLTNTQYFFLYSHSCLTGSFDNWNCWSGYMEEDCIAEILTAEIPYGAFACILNARYGLGSETTISSPSGAYDESFFTAVFIKGIAELGRANHESKHDNVWRIDENGMRWCYYQTNLFGDPELSLKNSIPFIDVNITFLTPQRGYLYLADKIALPLSFLNHPLILGDITVAVDAQSTPSDMIKTVTFIVDHEVTHVADTRPYKWVWNTREFGVHTITIVATVAYGFTESAETTVMKFF